MSDEILLEGVKLCSFIGVPDEERRLPQALECDVILAPERNFEDLGDEIAGTVDYAVVWNRLREVAWERERKLLETLAEDLCSMLLKEFALISVSISLKKEILPGTHAVGVSIRRERKTHV